LTFTAFLNGAVVSEFTAFTGTSGFYTTEFWVSTSLFPRPDSDRRCERQQRVGD
jgi:hypothetical protein